MGRELIWAAPWKRWTAAAMEALIEARHRFRDDCGPYAGAAPPLALHVLRDGDWLDTGYRAPHLRELHGLDVRCAMERTTLSLRAA